MTNKQRADLIRKTIVENPNVKDKDIAKLLKSPEEWGRLYERFKDEFAKLKERGVRVGELPSMSDFTEQWARGYTKHAKEFTKNPMRAIIESQKIVSKLQAEAWREGFTEKSVETFLSRNKALRDAFAEWQKDKEHEGVEYGKPKGISLTEDQEKALKKLAKLGPRQIRSEKFKQLYEKVKDVMKDYYTSKPESQRRTGKRGTQSWFYEIWYLE